MFTKHLLLLALAFVVLTNSMENVTLDSNDKQPDIECLEKTKIDDIHFKVEDYDLTGKLTLENSSSFITITLTDYQTNFFKILIDDCLFQKHLQSQFGKIEIFFKYLQSIDKQLISFEKQVLTVRVKRYVVSGQIFQKEFQFLAELQKLTQEQINQNLWIRVKSLQSKITGRQFSQGQEKRMKELEKAIQTLQNMPGEYFQYRKYSFSESEKASSIRVSQNNKFAQKIQGDSNSFVMLQETLGLRKHRVEFKIHSLQHAIVFGITNYFGVKAKSFVDQHWLRHSYGFHSNRVIYDGYGNHLGHSISLVAGEILVLEVLDNKIIFYKKNTKQAIVMHINYSQEQWNDACLYVLLYRAGDSVIILN